MLNRWFHIVIIKINLLTLYFKFFRIRILNCLCYCPSSMLTVVTAKKENEETTTKSYHLRILDMQQTKPLLCLGFRIHVH